jgi:uncharacterized protein
MLMRWAKTINVNIFKGTEKASSNNFWSPRLYLTRTTFVHTLQTVKIEWDPNKAHANLVAHGVAFADAATVLTDEYALTLEDPDSANEQRFVSLGMSATGSLLVVVYTHREPNRYRIISSWKAGKPQRKMYEKNRR